MSGPVEWRTDLSEDDFQEYVRRTLDEIRSSLDRIELAVGLPKRREDAASDGEPPTEAETATTEDDMECRIADLKAMRRALREDIEAHRRPRRRPRGRGPDDRPPEPA